MSELMEIINSTKAGVTFGVVHLDLKIHDGELVTVDAQKYASHKTPKGNVEALAIVTQLIRGSSQAKETGNLTLTIAFKEGDATRVLVQDMKRNDMKKR
jgi:hypothetical protein